MTVTISVHVNGAYKATVQSKREDGTPLADVVVTHGETKTLPHYHGETMTYTVLEEAVPAPGSGVEQNQAAPVGDGIEHAPAAGEGPVEADEERGAE